jgi:hypothetical protein
MLDSQEFRRDVPGEGDFGKLPTVATLSELEAFLPEPGR